MRFLSYLLIFFIGLGSGLGIIYFTLAVCPAGGEAWCNWAVKISEIRATDKGTTTSGKNAATTTTNGVEANYLAQNQSKNPILMYHHVKDAKSTDNAVEKGLSVAPLNFEEQMAYLYAKGYATIPLSQLFSDRNEKRIVITFDDGYKDVYTNAYPVMSRLGFKGTVFLITDSVGKPGYLTWEEVKQMKKDGWDFGSHSVGHPNLATRSQSERERQIKQSKLVIEQKIGGVANFFSYPVGSYNEDVINDVKEAGYEGAVTTISGNVNSQKDWYVLKRVRVSAYDDLASFAKKLKPVIPKPEDTAKDQEAIEETGQN